MRLTKAIILVLLICTACMDSTLVYPVEIDTVELEAKSLATACSIDEYIATSDDADKRGFQIQSKREEDVTEPVFLVESIPPEIESLVIGSSWADEGPLALSELVYLTVTYINFEGDVKLGHLIMHKAVGDEVAEIFQELFEAEFPIAGVELIDFYDADDVISMEANNSYAFCTRMIYGSYTYSNHSYGIAIDINPVQNPYVVGSTIFPEEGAAYLDRADIRPGMIVPGTPCYDAFISRGWSWGGNWYSPDYQHFEKLIF